MVAFLLPHVGMTNAQTDGMDRWTVPEDTVPTNLYMSSYLSTVWYSTASIRYPAAQLHSCTDVDN